MIQLLIIDLHQQLLENIIFMDKQHQSSSTGQLKRYSLIIRKNGSNYKFMSNYLQETKHI